MIRKKVHFGLAALVAGAPAFFGCGLLYEYPKTNAEQSSAACSDGLDNDLDGRADCYDSGCSDFCLESDELACADGLDNDADGDIDCRDGSCFDFCKEESAQTCSDDKDNDADGDVDCLDAACASFCVETSEAACADGEDNDADGATDCLDDGCAEHCPEAGAAACRDHEDNDHDGDTDCQDSGCDGFCPEQSSADCEDERDNDGDGLTDGADPLCWPVRAPHALRCAGAPATDFAEPFDSHSYLAPFFAPRWFEYGMSNRIDEYGELLPVVDYIYRLGLERHDDYLRFTANTAKTGVLERDLGGLVSSRLFSGLWRDFSFSALVLVPRNSQVRFMLSPEHLAPAGAEPLAGAESAQLGIVLDGTAASPTLALLVEGQSFSTELPLPAACGLSYCEGGWANLTLRVEGDRFKLQVDGVGESGGVEAPLPEHDAFEASRLVVRGGTTDGSVTAGIDDISLALAGGTPCNAVVPQVPAASCEAAAAFDNYGYGVSVAPSGKAYCALIVAGHESAEAITSWTTGDGLTLERADLSVELPAEASPYSVALANADDGLGLAVSYVQAGQLLTGLGNANDCTGKVALADGPPLPPDAEELSYVIAGGQHQLFFTRPPTDQTQRTLWRFDATSQAGLAKLNEAELLAELPAGTNHPAVVQRIGATDLVLSYPTLATQGPPGAGVLVADAAARDWKTFEPNPLLAESAVPGFDEQGVRSVALAASEAGGFLLYGGAAAGALMTGTARLELAGVEAGELPALRSCGDGECAENESCATCSADCECAGPTLLSDVLSQDAGWQYIGGLGASGDSYFNETSHALNWAATSSDSWLALPLVEPISGDFEISFDLSFEASGDVAECDSAYIGLGTLPDDITPPSGVFARISFEAWCSSDVLLSPYVQTPDERFRSFGPISIGMCRSSPLKGSLERKMRLVLRRQGGDVTLLTADANACESEAHLSYSGALPELSTLLFGTLEDCGLSTSGRISNLEVRLASDPEHCPAQQEVCGTGAAAGCVDTRSSQEHCGACDHACAAGQACVASECVCDSRYLACDGSCTDPLTDYDHCGTCDGVCDSFCFIGQCDAGETCDNPAVLAAGSTSSHFDIWYRVADLTALCSEPSQGDAFFSWTAEKSGQTSIEVMGVDGEVDMELALAEDLSCATFSKCESFTSGLGDGQRIRFVAKAGTEYRIAVAIVEAPPAATGSVVELRIEAP